MGQLAGGLECAGHVAPRGHRHVGTDKHVIRDASVFGDEYSLHQPDIGAEHRTFADHRSNPDHAAVTDTHALSNDNMMGRLHVRSEDDIFIHNGCSAKDAAFADSGARTGGEIAVR